MFFSLKVLLIIDLHAGLLGSIAGVLNREGLISSTLVYDEVAHALLLVIGRSMRGYSS